MLGTHAPSSSSASSSISTSTSASSAASAATTSSAPPPLSFGMAHSPSASTSGESAASTPVGAGAGTFFHFQHLPLHRPPIATAQHQHQHQQPHGMPPPHHSPFHAGVIAHPRLHLNTMIAVDDGGDDYYERNGGGGGGSPGGGVLSMSPACNFEAFSLHFHLPLKTAAEKFGVRATAFKKRCRAIGIRHWPYRKVRSLKRSLQELGRCHEQGALNDKQQYQYATFKKQLDKLMSPETYGIDPSGRLTQTHFDESDDESDDNESCASATPSPRYGATFSDCSISPADGDKTFGDFSSPAHLRALRSKQSHQQQYLQPPFGKSLTAHFSPELQHHPLHRLQPPKDPQLGLFHKFPLAGAYDPFPHEAELRGKAPSAARAHLAQPPQAHAAHADENDEMGERAAGGEGGAAHEFLPSDVRYEDARPLADAADDFGDHGAHMDYTNDRFFDDVFLQISPDYGCLV